MPTSQPSSDRQSLWDLTLAVDPAQRFIGDANQIIPLLTAQQLSGMTNLAQFHDQTVLIVTGEQLETALIVLELDGIAKRILLGTPDLQPYFPAIIAEAEVDMVVTDQNATLAITTPVCQYHRDLSFPSESLDRSIETEWILFTSGTTGQPKMVIHTLASLVGPLDDGLAITEQSVWSTFYDIRRYGGLQILLRALLSGGSMVLSRAQPIGDFLLRLGDYGVTHISGTPSHWRLAIMSPQRNAIDPRYVRLSGEIVDQTILEQLKQVYPKAAIAHAFASTEAGVAFDVRDGNAGFPVDYIDHPTMQAKLRIINGSLHVYSARIASGYIGRGLNATDGFIDTGDLVVRENDRYYFKGRREGTINVGGQKVFPEEVEAVLNQHPAIRIARARARRNPIMGSLVIADVVLADPTLSWSAVRDDILTHCRSRLAQWKVPTIVRAVETIELTAAGKVARHA